MAAVRVKAAFSLWMRTGNALEEIFKNLKDEDGKIKKGAKAYLDEMIQYYDRHLNTHTGNGFFADVIDEYSGTELFNKFKLIYQYYLIT